MSSADPNFRNIQGGPDYYASTNLPKIPGNQENQKLTGQQKHEIKQQELSEGKKGSQVDDSVQSYNKQNEHINIGIQAGERN